MSTLTRKLDDFETKIQAFIEGKLSRLSPIQSDDEELVHLLVSSLRANTITINDGTLLAPDKFTLLVHPTSSENLNDDPETLVAMADLIKTAGEKYGLHFVNKPVVSISFNKDVPVDQIEVVSRISNQALGQTGGLSKTATPDPNPNSEVNAIPHNAFLILNGKDVIMLDKTVINIGRRSNNHISIDDPRVSRQHAQIRASNGRYEIFDLDSTGGTFINQKPIKQSLLRPGDVISLAGVYLIYGQESSSSLKDTQKLSHSDIFGQSDQ